MEDHDKSVSSIAQLSRRQYLSTVSVGTAAAVAGCLGDDDDEGGPITYTDRSDVTVDIYSERFNEWQEENFDEDDQVEVEGNFNDDQYDDILTQVRAGEHPAEVIGVDVVRLESFDNLEMLKDISSLVEGLEYRDEFLEGTDPGFTQVNDKIVGVPSWIDPSLFFYNIDHFEEAGLNHPPENWDELAEAMEVLSDDDFPAFGGNFAAPGLDQFHFFPWAWANGGQYVSDDGTESTVDEDPVVDTIEFWKDLQDQGYTTDLVGSEWPDWHSLFINEDISMIMTSPAEFVNIQEENEDMFNNYLGGGLPFGRDGANKSSFLGGNAMSIFDSTEGADLEAAERFLEWLNTEDGMLATQEAGFMPARPRGYEIGSYAESPWDGHLETPEQALEVGNTLTHEETSSMSSVVASELQLAFSGEKTAQEAMTDAADEINSDLL